MINRAAAVRYGPGALNNGVSALLLADVADGYPPSLRRNTCPAVIYALIVD